MRACASSSCAWRRTLAVGKSTLHRAVEGGDDMQTVTHKVLQDAVSALANLERHVVPQDLERAAARIARARRVDCYGVGNVSMFMASDAQARFARLGITAGAYFDAHLQLISAAHDEPQRDVVLAISYVGRMRSLMQCGGGGAGTGRDGRRDHAAATRRSPRWPTWCCRSSSRSTMRCASAPKPIWRS